MNPSTTAPAAGRHRRSVPPRSPLATAFDVVGRLGSLVTLAALLVVAGAVGGLVDGVPAPAEAVTTATLGGR